LLIVGALALAGSTALLTWWTTTLTGLPDVGDPFDVAAFERPISDDSNAFVLYKQAVAILPNEPADLTGDWGQAGPAERQWLEASREALETWRRGTERPDALDVSPVGATFETKLEAAQKLRAFARLALLQGSKLEIDGDVEGALVWYLALLRSSRHCGRRGFFIERHIGIAMNNLVSTRLTHWAADPEADARMLRKALDAAYAAEEATPPTSDGLKAEYISFLHSLDDPELMLRIHDSISTPNAAGGSVTHYGGGWRSSLTRVKRRALNEPERSRRVIRLVFANWLAYCDRPSVQRPSRVRANPSSGLNSHAKALLADLYVVDATAPEPARSLPPEKVAAWYGTTIDAEMALPAFFNVERAIARERSVQGNLLVALANELHKREHGKYPEHVEELVGPYLKALPEGHGSAK
jgi:hypothetical protein